MGCESWRHVFTRWTLVCLATRRPLAKRCIFLRVVLVLVLPRSHALLLRWFALLATWRPLAARPILALVLALLVLARSHALRPIWLTLVLPLAAVLARRLLP